MEQIELQRGIEAILFASGEPVDAARLAMAMEARCYNGGEGRTKMKPLVYGTEDKLAYIVLVVFLILVIVARIFVPFPQ